MTSPESHYAGTLRISGGWVCEPSTSETHSRGADGSAAKAFLRFLEMSSHTDKPDIATPRLWCVPAPNSPIVAVLARCYGEPRWTCVLRWNWLLRTVEEGAWTKLHIRAHRCTLSHDGEFLLYHAEGPSKHPFSGFFGGAFAVSRLPWLSALTHPDTFGPAGATLSRDALPLGEQASLWAEFKDWPMYVGDKHWPRHLGLGWTSITLEHAARFGVERRNGEYLAASCEFSGTRMAIVAVVVAGRNRHDETSWSVWHDDLKYFLVSTSDRALSSRALPGVRWVHVAKTGHLLVADDQAMLKVWRFKHKSDPDHLPRTVFEHSLKTLAPTPRAAPAWAKVPLSPAR